MTAQHTVIRFGDYEATIDGHVFAVATNLQQTGAATAAAR